MEIPDTWCALYPRGRQQHVNMTHPSISGNCKVHWWHIITHFFFGLILLESAFPFPSSFLLSTVCLRCLFYGVIKIIFSGAVPFIYQLIHPYWINFLFPGRRLSLLTQNNPWLKWLSVDRQAGNLDRDPALRRSWITLWFWAQYFLMSPLPNYPSFCCKNPLLSAKVHIFLTWSRPHWHLILFMLII